MAVPEELHYTKEHEWVLVDGSTATVGITAYAAEKLGDVVFVELPAVGTEAAEGRVIGEIESTKSVGELFSPMAGTVVEVNEVLSERPELVSSDPFGEGWLIKLSIDGPVAGFLSYDEYAALTGEGSPS